jgi:hypothetical protein
MNSQQIAFNTSQKDQSKHPFTCGGPNNVRSCYRTFAYESRMHGIQVPFTTENEGVLLGTEDGMVCPCGGYNKAYNNENI